MVMAAVHIPARRYLHLPSIGKQCTGLVGVVKI